MSQTELTPKDSGEPQSPPPESSAEIITETPVATADTGSSPDIEELVRQAYLKGRNEAIESLLKQPQIMQPLDINPKKSDTEPYNSSEILILNNLRPSIWDK